MPVWEGGLIRVAGSYGVRNGVCALISSAVCLSRDILAVPARQIAKQQKEVHKPGSRKVARSKSLKASCVTS